MSTRGLTGFRLNGKLKGSYNHFDSYPEGLGNDMVAWARELGKKTDRQRSDIIKKFEKVKFVDEHESKPTKKDIEFYKNFIDESVGGENGGKPTWYQVLCKIQGVDGFREIENGKLKHLIDGTDFLKDSLFCEYAYVINFDDFSVEFYRGFNSVFEGEDGYDDIPAKDDYDIHIEKIIKNHELIETGRKYKYGPSKMVAKIPIKDLIEKEGDWWHEVFGTYDEDDETIDYTGKYSPHISRSNLGIGKMITI